MGLRQRAQEGFLEAVAPLPKLKVPQIPTLKASLARPQECKHSRGGGWTFATSLSLSKPGRSLRHERVEPPLSWETKGKV